jgi:hypothetical protein
VVTLKRWFMVAGLATIAAAAALPAQAQHHSGGGWGGDHHGGGSPHGGHSGGEWHHGYHNGHNGWWWGWGAGAIWYPEPFWPYYPYPYAYPYPYPYPSPYAAPGAAMGAPGGEGQQPMAPPPQYWYRCDSPRGFYPYVTSCPGGWQEVPAMPPDAPHQ